MDVSDSPLALANSTKSLSMMLTIFSLVWRATEEIPVRLKAAAGRTAWRIRSAKEISSAVMPMGTLKPMGNHLK